MRAEGIEPSAHSGHNRAYGLFDRCERDERMEVENNALPVENCLAFTLYKLSRVFERPAVGCARIDLGSAERATRWSGLARRDVLAVAAAVSVVRGPRWQHRRAERLVRFAGRRQDIQLRLQLSDALELNVE